MIAGRRHVHGGGSSQCKITPIHPLLPQHPASALPVRVSLREILNRTELSHEPTLHPVGWTTQQERWKSNEQLPHNTRIQNCWVNRMRSIVVLRRRQPASLVNGEQSLFGCRIKRPWDGMVLVTKRRKMAQTKRAIVMENGTNGACHSLRTAFFHVIYNAASSPTDYPSQTGRKLERFGKSDAHFLEDWYGTVIGNLALSVISH